MNDITVCKNYVFFSIDLKLSACQSSITLRQWICDSHITVCIEGIININWCCSIKCCNVRIFCTATLRESIITYNTEFTAFHIICCECSQFSIPFFCCVGTKQEIIMTYSTVNILLIFIQMIEVSFCFILFLNNYLAFLTCILQGSTVICIPV